jgi:hypothetical protein
MEHNIHNEKVNEYLTSATNKKQDHLACPITIFFLKDKVFVPKECDKCYYNIRAQRTYELMEVRVLYQRTYELMKTRVPYQRTYELIKAQKNKIYELVEAKKP